MLGMRRFGVFLGHEGDEGDDGLAWAPALEEPGPALKKCKQESSWDDTQVLSPATPRRPSPKDLADKTWLG